MRRATYKILDDDQSYFGEIPDFQGVWANEDTLAACCEELQSALEDWILYRLWYQLPLPVVEELDLNRQEMVTAEAA